LPSSLRLPEFHARAISMSAATLSVMAVMLT
jgi:hypothetical protein